MMRIKKALSEIVQAISDGVLLVVRIKIKP